MKYRSLLLLVLALALLVGAWLLAREQWQVYHRVTIDDTHPTLADEPRSGPLPLNELLARLTLPADTRIVEIEQEPEHGAFVYEIEVLEPDGRVRELLVDARSGRILGEEHPDQETEERHHAPVAGGR